MGKLVFVTAYTVEREFGGREEGGWYFNNYQPIECRRVPEEQAEAKKSELEEKHKDVKWGNIYSVLGGTDLQVIIERQAYRNQTKSRPYYE